MVINSPKNNIFLSNIEFILSPRLSGFMKSSFCIFFIAFFVLTSGCFSKAAESTDESDTLLAIDSLNQLCMDFWLIDPIKSVSFGEEALQLANRINNGEKISNSMRNLGGAYLYQGKHHAALVHLYKSLKIARNEHFKTGIKNSLNSLGVLYFRLGDFQNALFYHTESFKIKKELNDTPGIASSLNHIGEVYQKLKDYDTAIKYFYEALDITGKLEKETLLVGTLNNIGSLYSDRKNYEKAITYFNQAIELCEKSDNIKGLADAYRGLGIAHELENNFSEAEINFKKSLELSLMVSDKINISENYYHLAWQAFKRKDYELASKENYKSYELALAMGAKEKLMDIYGLYAQIYSRWKDYEGAYSYLVKANNLKETLFHEKLNKDLALVQMAEEEAKYQEALLLKDLEIKETKARSTMLTIILVLTGAICILIYKRYEHKKKIGKHLNDKNIQITKQNQEIEDQKKVLEVKNEELIKAKELITEQNERLSKVNVKLDKSVQAKTAQLIIINEELEKALKELDTFIYKTSHDIRGPLARLMGLCNVALIDVQDKKSLEYFEMLNATANYLNSTLVRLLTIVGIKNSDFEIESIDFEALLDKLLMENSVHEGFKDIKFDINVEKGIKFQSDPSIIKLILHNLIENSIKYYNNQPDIDSFISIRIKSDEGHLQINVIDNGVGINGTAKDLFEMFSRVSTKGSNGGLGLYMVKVCVEKLKGKISLVENPSQFTEFSIELPFEKRIKRVARKFHLA